MRCKDIERLIIDSSERKLSQEERLAIEQHKAHCAGCVRFQNDWERIQHSLKKMPAPILPSGLEEQTLRMCHTKKSSLRSADKQPGLQIRPVSIPLLIWAVLVSLIILTVIVLIPLVRELRLDQTMNLQTLIVLTLILQNAVMLIFAPIVIRKYRSQKQGFGLA